jgi:hypothetical protein
MIRRRLLFGIGTAAAVCAAALPIGAAAQSPTPGIRRSAECASSVTNSDLPEPLLRITGGRTPEARTVFGARDMVLIDGGTKAGVSIGNDYYIRRSATFGAGRRTGVHPSTTIGRLKILSVNDTAAIALIEMMCDEVTAGDYLEPYAAPVLPEGVDRVDTAGKPDFSAFGRVLFGQEERLIGAVGDFMIADVGQENGVAPGTRFEIYRDLQVDRLPLVPIGEAIAVSVTPKTSLIRITASGDAIRGGDLLVQRR